MFATPLDAPVSARILRGDARHLSSLADASVDLVVTSPPYWQIKDYGTPGQIGWGQSLHDYLRDMARVWAECARVLRPGRRLCVNIGDQFARARIYGRYKIIPLHAEVIAQAQAVGLDYLGAIIWQKKTTLNPSGGAVVMGSFPHPANGIVELDYEYILLFKKPGTGPKVSPERKSASRLTTEEWKLFFSGHWTFGGVRQQEHEAMFPEELPRRLIRMFSFVDDTVLDPFMGSGTTAKAALDLHRNAIGYEINPRFLKLIEERLADRTFTIEEGATEATPRPAPVAYVPQTEDAAPIDDTALPLGTTETHKVCQIIDERTLLLESGIRISLLGVRVPPAQIAHARCYLERYLRGKKVLLRFDGAVVNSDTMNRKDASLPAYVQLSNKLFINRKMIEMGLAHADRAETHKYRDKFIAAEKAAPSPEAVRETVS